MRKYLPPIVFVIVTALGFAMAGFAYVASDRANQLKFGAVADDALARIEARVELHLSLLNATHAYFVARRGDVDRAAFAAFVAGLHTETRYAGIQGIGYSPLLRPGSQRGASDRISENYGIGRELWPATDQEWRAPITLLEPMNERNVRALGYDMFAEPVRRAAIIGAVEYALPQASGPVNLVLGSDDEQRLGFVVYIPFVKPDRTLTEGSLQLADVAGFVFAPFRIDDLFKAALVRSPVLPVQVSAYDEVVSPQTRIFRSEELPTTRSPDRYTVNRQSSVAGRIWQFQFRPTAAFDPSFSSLISLVLGVVSLLLAAALAASARTQNRALEASTALHEADKRNLAEREMMLQEMKHRIKNSITRILAVARQTAPNAESVADFMDAYSARLQSMARSQDILTRSRWQRAELREVLMNEVRQVLGDEIDDRTIAGPPVELSESATQALGLTFHELATNALKYGPVQPDGRGLRVTWRLAGGRRKLVEIRWQEAGGSGIETPSETGFGTRLIDSNIVHELGGSIEREYCPDGLKVFIRIPIG